MTDSNGRYRIIAVCLGNICRSPMAAAVLTARFERAGLSRHVSIDSAGTGGWHAGEPADPRARAALSAAGYPSAHRAQQFKPEWFDDADLIVGMDYANVLDVRGMAPDSEAAARVLIMRSFDPALMHLPEDDQFLSVPDPYYGTDTEFADALEMIEQAADGIVDQVRLAIAQPIRLA